MPTGFVRFAAAEVYIALPTSHSRTPSYKYLLKNYIIIFFVLLKSVQYFYHKFHRFHLKKFLHRIFCFFALSL